MVQRYNSDYVMHAARFAPFARENEHGEYVKFSAYEALVSELTSSRQINAQTLQVKLTIADTIKELAVENAELNNPITGKPYINYVTSNGWSDRADGYRDRFRVHGIIPR
ncbi:hypothetical protein I5P92_08840 [Serratia ureilytica]|uniref:hypothetical protein n=1 Tax=Serratia ureilytica TaxID=300181 RepID=UPI0018D6E39D|nr:hypothetical protein [Serratia ureilytica]MBH3155883.1 hypothetical protein [Serratia ureilytica]MBH3250973.1 hypothetical protein [Serratia ureilytica]